MRDKLDLASSQIDSNIRKQAQLQEDLDNKDMTQDIDSTCRELNNLSKNIQIHAGIEKLDANGSEPESWRKYSLKNREESQASRALSAQVRLDIENLLNAACSEMVSHWNITNQAFKQRIQECQETHKQLQTKLNLVNKEIIDLDTHVNKIKTAIRAKGGPLKVSQTRLEKRSHRPDIENCSDSPHLNLVKEVTQIQENVDKLNEMLNEAQEARADLLNNKLVLERDLQIKTISLRIDEQKCLAARSRFPYQTKCDVASKNPVYYYVYYNIV
ncbi:tektin-3 [Eurytemora carolleeae]|uniref:tektin-3 n=1 Tax=Eurytemora carolleeae TaxID=1294199 RepID=UPI000C76C0C0|nr:tektin-3 [Eurytemora carolleeae]|eukprot:XP_023346922.1 tektin-3-like [Eurytemora affinis]